MTARTTAHLATELDDFYSELIRVRGEDEARVYYDSQVAAVNRIEAICREEGINADFARVDGFLFPAEEGHRVDLEEEYQACVKIGVDIEWVDNAPIPGIRTGRAPRFPDQGRLHPTKYLAGLAGAVLTGGGRIYANTAYVSHSEPDDWVEITTEGGHKIRAGTAVFATNSPVNDNLAIHTKQSPYRTYQSPRVCRKDRFPTPSSGIHTMRITMFAFSRSAPWRTSLLSAARTTVRVKHRTWRSGSVIWSSGRATATRV
jgi:glycine/D-amino acid oxidase-like deaminating enzyme